MSILAELFFIYNRTKKVFLVERKRKIWCFETIEKENFFQ